MSRPCGESQRIIRLCVDGYDRGIMQGRCYHPGLGDEEVAFHSFVQFLVSMETILDQARFPQSYTARRSFGPMADAPYLPAAGVSARNGALGTFTIRILFRQHASWQGSVRWLEGKGEQTFRSVLELILLIDSALNGSAGLEGEN